ncbi:MAG: phosphate ABC transporter permease subunit PstC [Micromonosporaceae bacterium]|nr:phosphate ABC transporter permease subunit PstC [Micromonosporaceae bacterium]
MSRTSDHLPPHLTSRGGGVLGDRVFRWLTLAAGLLVLAVLALILVFTVKEAWPAIQHEGVWGFLTGDRWVPNDPDGPGPARPMYGALAFIYGTVVTSLIAVIIAVPISVGIALFLTEFAPRRLRGPVITVIDLLAAVPSVVFGLWAILVLGPWLFDAYQATHGLLGAVPVLGSIFGPPQGPRAFMTAGIIVAIMIIPIITSITREVFATVPNADKQAALALGATRWEMIRGAVFPHSFGGVVGAVMLGLGRAMGETIAVSLTIGAATQITANLFGSGNTLPARIVQNWGDPGIPPGRSALVGLGVVLFLITIIVNYLARLVVSRAEIRMKGASA